MTDLSRLNDQERRVLALLAEGHTAKSIAAALGRTEAAVNERLRDARRKTGMGSSRELARLVRAQETWDERNDVVASPTAPSAPGRAPLTARSRGVLIMTATTICLAAALALLAPAQKPAPFTAEPLFAEVAGDASDPAWRLHAQLEQEARNQSWAEAGEAALLTRYGNLPGVAAGVVRSDCRVDLCEVLGRSGPLAAGDYDRAVEALRKAGATDQLASLGLTGASLKVVEEHVDGERRFAFLGYWRRTNG